MVRESGIGVGRAASGQGHGWFQMDANPLIQKLEHSGYLGDAERALLRRVCAATVPVAIRQDIIRVGDRPEDVHLVLDGFACRCKMLANGDRQIVAVLVSGDFCDLRVAILGAMDHTIATLTACTLVRIPQAAILEMTEGHPRLSRALWWATLVDEAVLREWLVNLGQRPADRRSAHFFCELLVRMQVAGVGTEADCPMPIRQADLADILGLTDVHVNRTLQELREAGLIVLKSRRLTVPDVGQLRAFCGFEASYLHLIPRVAALE